MHKIIHDVFGRIDVGKVLPIVDSLQFQKMRYRKQLAVTYLIFINALHNRLAHSLGTYQRTVIRTDRWLSEGLISKEDAHLLRIFGLTHDIGHGPYSHVSETLCSIDHEQNGIAIIRQIQPQIEECNVDFDKLIQLFERKNPFYKAVMAHPLGTEKIDYLRRDSLTTDGGIRDSEIDNLEENIIFIKDELTINSSVIEEARQLQDRYMTMYKKVYLRKSALICQAFVQKLIMKLLKNGLSEQELWPMTDDELSFYMMNHALTKEMWNNFLYRQQMPKLAISLKLEQFINEEMSINVEEKNIKIFGIDQEEINILAKITPRRGLSELEEKISEIAKIPNDCVIISYVTSPERFVPKDIQIVDIVGKGKRKKFSTLFQELKDKEDKKAKSSWEETLYSRGQSALAFRICSFEKYRAILLEKAEEIKECALDFAKNL